MTNYIKTLLIFLGYSIVTLPIHSQSLPDSTIKKIDNLFKKWDRSDSPGCSLGVPQDSIDGEWVGAFELSRELIYLRVGFKSEEHWTKLTVFSMTPGAPGPTTDVRLDSTRVRFELPKNSEKMLFDGQLQGQMISGSVRHDEDRGTFQLTRTVQVNPKLYDEYAGAYELQSNRIVFIRRGDRLRQEPPYSIEESFLYYVQESGERRILYPSSETRFFSGPMYGVPVPVELEVTFVRNKEGKVKGLAWRERGLPERFAPRSRLYTEEEVRFANGDTTLAGRLLIPSNKGPHPAVVLVHGYGASNRNTDYFIVADVFARHGIAALVYDKRGTGASPGDWREASYADLADDALAAVQFLYRRKDIIPREVGLWSLSAGGPVAASAAARSSEVAFLILVSATVLPTWERYPMMIEAWRRADGFSEEEIKEVVAFAKLESEFGRTGEGWEAFQSAIEKARDKKWFSQTWTAVFGATSKDHRHWRELRREADEADPRLVLRKVTCPVLVIYGELDVSVPPGPHIAALEKGLSEAGNRDYTVKVFPKGSHNLWLLETGVQKQHKTYVPGYFETMIEWLLKRVDVVK